MMNEGLSASDVALLTGNTGNNNGGNGMWGDNGWMWLIVLFLFAGGRGFGSFGGGGGYDGSGGGTPIVIGGNTGCCGSPCATQEDVRAAVDQQTLVSKLDQQTYGLADSTYALNNTIMGGFHGVDNAICTLGYNVQQGFNTLGYQMKDCCCETQRLIERGFCDTNYNIQQQSCDTRNTIQNTTRDIIDNANSNTRAILDFLTQDKIATLTAENQSLKFQASQTAQNAFITANQEAQTATLLRRLGADCPTPAYVVQPPTPVTFPTNCCGQVQFGGYGNSCGCGCS